MMAEIIMDKHLSPMRGYLFACWLLLEASGRHEPELNEKFRSAGCMFSLRGLSNPYPRRSA